MLLHQLPEAISRNMDPASTAGIGLAVMSLTAQCFTGAMQAIQLITSARNMEPEYRYLDVRLRLEQQRLYNWSSETGLLRCLQGDNDTSNCDLLGLSHGTVAETLMQIHRLTADFIECREKCGELVADEAVMDDCETEHSCSDDSDLTRFPNLVQYTRRSKSVKFGFRGWPKRLKWATFYKDKYEQMVDKVRILNDVLIDLVDSNARIAIRRSTRETNTTVLHLHTKIDELFQLVKAATPVYRIDRSDYLVTTSQSCDFPDLNEQRDLANLAHFKAVNTSVEANTYFNLNPASREGRRIHDIEMKRSDFSILPVVDEGSNRCEADYQPICQQKKRVWIEWREYDPIYLGQPVLKPSRIDKLVALLSDSTLPDLLRVPRCLGYFDDPKSKANSFRKGRLGFVFEKPTSLDGLPISLRQLLKSRSKPLLTDRIVLAVAIANCVMSLHSVNWLHKGLRSHNIIFFPDKLSESDSIDLSSPYLSGFGYARPVFREDMTELPSQNPEYDMYKHPRMHLLGHWEGRQGFKRTFDIYSLGIVLIEIANWQSIDQILGLEDPKTLSDSDLGGIQKRLLNEKKFVDGVGANAGTRFKEATMSCLDSKSALGMGYLDDETNVQVASKLSQNFHQKVIRPLEEIKL